MVQEGAVQDIMTLWCHDVNKMMSRR